MKQKPIVFVGGQYYACDARGVQDQIEPADVDQVDQVLVVCRWLADFPFDRVPATCAIGRCAQCRASIVYDPNGPHQDVPKLCMQCVGVEPLPFETVQ